MSLVIVVEGDTDIPVARALAADARLGVAVVQDMGGKSRLDARLSGFNNAAKGTPWFVLRDLDTDAGCAPEFLTQVPLTPSAWMVFRLAVREVESWLLADIEGMSKFLHVPATQFPADPDAESDPTVTLVNLARKSSRTAIQKAFIPAQGANTQVGPLYETSIIEFGARHWDLNRACGRSASLRRARAAMRDLGRRWRQHIGTA